MNTNRPTRLSQRAVPGRRPGGPRALVTLLALLFFTAVHAVDAGQVRGDKFTLKLTNAPLSQLFEQIEARSNYKFDYNPLDTEKVGRINFSCTKAELLPILENVLGKTELKYSINGNVVTISRRDGKVTERPKDEGKKITVTGEVMDVANEPLVGATVRMQGVSRGVITDAAGRYSLTVPETADLTLVFSYVGMHTQYVKYTGKKVMNVVMKEASNEMNAVVIQTGYQAVDKRKATGAVTTLKADDVLVPGIHTIDNMLEGLVPGLTTMRNSGQVGAAAKLRIRGTSTVLGSQEPLWVIDGIVQSDPINIDPQQINDLDFVNLLGNAVSGLNPEDIEQIDILKDAAATAIYGTRAANGVIVVTTKRGEAGPPKISYSFNGTISRRPHYSDKFVNMMNSAERIQFSRDLIEQRVGYPRVNSWVGYEGAIRDYWKGNTTFEEMQKTVGYYETLNTDWFDLLTKDAFQHTHTVSLSGGSSVVRYYASLGLQDLDGNIKGENNRVYTANINLSASYKKLSLRFGVNASSSNRAYTPSDVGVMNYAYSTTRALPAYTEDGEPFTYTRDGLYYTEPVNFSILNDINDTWQTVKTNKISASATIDYRIIEPLKFSATLAYTMSNSGNQTYHGPNSYMGQSLKRATVEDALSLMPIGGQLKDNTTDNKSYTIRGQFSYDKYFGQSRKHNFSAALGGEISSTEYQNWAQLYRGYLPDRSRSMADIDLNRYTAYANWLQSSAAQATRTLSLTNIVSGYLVTTYDYDNRYVLNVNMRADASNQFGSRSREKFMPIWSLSGRWNVKKDLFKSSKMVNDLSLRASVGIQGNMLQTQTSELVILRGNYNDQFGAFGSTIRNFPNPDLSWEKTTSINTEIDFSLFNNKLSGMVSYFYKKTRDAFLTKYITTVNGLKSYVVNSGNVENQGVELQFTVTPINRRSQSNPYGFRWTMTPTFSDIMNKVHSSNTTMQPELNDEGEAVTYQQYLSGKVPTTGKSLNSFYSYKFTGLDPVDGRPTFYGTDQAEFADVFAAMETDQVYMAVMDYSGRRLPVISGGLSNTFSYNRFTLGLNFTYSLGSKVRLLQLYTQVSKASGTIAPQPSQNVRREFLNMWKKPGDENVTNIPGVLSDLEFRRTMDGTYNWWDKTSYSFATNIWNMYDYSTARVASGNYLKLNSLSLRYSFDRKLVEKWYMKSAYIGFSMTNVFTICDKALKGQDPASQSGSSTVLNMSMRPTYSLSLNVSF